MNFCNFIVKIIIKKKKNSLILSLAFLFPLYFSLKMKIVTDKSFIVGVKISDGHLNDQPLHKFISIKKQQQLIY